MDPTIDYKIEEIAERIRHEPFHSLTNNCFIKSIKFKRACSKLDIRVAVVASLSTVEFRRWGIHFWFLIIHAWAFANERRLEVARPLDEKSLWGTFDIDVIPIIGIWFW